MTNIKPGSVCRTHEDFMTTEGPSGTYIVYEISDSDISYKKFRKSILETLSNALHESLESTGKIDPLIEELESYALRISNVEYIYKKLSYEDRIRRTYKKMEAEEDYEDEDYEPIEQLAVLIHDLFELVMQYSFIKIKDEENKENDR